MYAQGDVYPGYSKLPKGDYNLQLYLRYEPFSAAGNMIFLFLFKLPTVLRFNFASLIWFFRFFINLSEVKK